MSNGDTRTFAVMAKPIGAACNLRCTYCYYTDRGPDLHGAGQGTMSGRILEAYIARNIEAHGKAATVEFAWHGGEPTLCGIDFFKRVLELQKKHGSGRNLVNTLQTNGTLLDDAWCEFFKKNDFVIGISIDGPKFLNDRYRRDARGGGSFDAAMRGLRFLKKHGVQFNTLTAVNAANSRYPREVYAFLSEVSDFIQFLPVVEPLENGVPPGINSPSAESEEKAASYSVEPELYGDFLCRVFDAWRAGDIGKKFVQTFEAAIGNMMRKPAGVCVHEPTCGHAASVEADGTLYSCDRYAFAPYELGNILETPLFELLESNRGFGLHKAQGLVRECQDCRWLGLCWGGCPKDRRTPVPDGYKNRLCAGYRKFYAHLERTVRIEEGRAR